MPYAIYTKTCNIILLLILFLSLHPFTISLKPPVHSSYKVKASPKTGVHHLHLYRPDFS